MIEFIAGVIDARAHISFTTRRGELYPRIRVTTKRIELLDYLALHTGVDTRIDHKGYKRRGCTEHCEERHIHGSYQSPYWNVDATRATVVLWNVLPELICQTGNALIALRTGAKNFPDGRAEVPHTMRRLGWEIPTKADLKELLRGTDSTQSNIA